MIVTPSPEPSARAWRDRLQAGELSSRELLTQVLERLEDAHGLNAVVALDAELALDAAAAADAARRAGDRRRLLGLPITIKDSIETQDLPTTSGSFARKGFRAPADASVVGRLRAEGAVIVAKTNVPEYTWSYETDNALFGRTVHPADSARTPGGSSGGEAAVLAADASIVGIGSDGGGSIRVPCHYCGIVGLRPTAGLVPETGCWPPTRDTGMVDMNSVGPMARYVEDLALLLPIIAGADGIDPFVHGVRVGSSDATDVRGLRVGFYDDDGVATPDPATKAAVRAAADALEDHGCTVEPAVPPDLSAATDLFFGMMAADGGARARADLAPAAGRHTPQITRLLEDLTTHALDAAGYFALFDDWAALRAQIRAYVSHHDVVVAPVTTGAAPRHGCEPGRDRQLDSYLPFNYTHAYSIAGLPVAVVPVGRSEDSLPIGVQVIAQPFRDDVALAAAATLEAAHGGFSKTLSTHAATRR
jgi:amidase